MEVIQGEIPALVLSEDYRKVAARKLLERKQGTKESFRDFAFQYRSLCL